MRSLEAQEDQRHPRRPQGGDYASSVSDASDLSDPELLYPSSAKLDPGDALVQIKKALCGPCHAACWTEPFSDFIGNQWILHPNSAAVDPCEESSEALVHKLKFTTKFLLDMRWQLTDQNCQLCHELKQEYFAAIAGPCINNLLEVACSFSRARWTAGHIVHMLTLFGTLADVLYIIWDLSFTRIEFIHNKVASIFHNMVNAVKGILETTNDMHRSKEHAIHPSTCFLIQVLEFFYRYKDMVQPILAPEDYISLLHCWVSKLEEDAERMFQDEKDRQHIFILNNIWFIWQKRDHPRRFVSNEQLGRLHSVIQQYISSYLDGYWAPLLTYLEGDSLRRPCQSSLDKFTVDFNSKLDRQMRWKVQTELKIILRGKITSLIVQPYEQFLVALEKTPSSTCFVIKRLILDLLFFGQKKGDIYTVEPLESALKAIFER